MARTVVGIFDNETEAREAMQKLQNQGIARNNIDLSLPTPSTNRSTGTTAQQTGMSQDRNWDRDTKMDTGSTMTGGSGGQSWNTDADRSNRNMENNPEFNRTSTSSGMGGMNQGSDVVHGSKFSDREKNQDGGNLFDRIGHFFSSLFDNDDDARRYTQAGQSRTIVTVHTNSLQEAERAADIMDECGAIDTDNQTSYHHASGDIGSMGMNSDRIMKESMSNTNTGSTNRSSDMGRRSRIFDRPVEQENRLNSDYDYDRDEEYDSLNRKPIL